MALYTCLYMKEILKQAEFLSQSCQCQSCNSRVCTGSKSWLHLMAQFLSSWMWLAWYWDQPLICSVSYNARGTAEEAIWTFTCRQPNWTIVEYTVKNSTWQDCPTLASIRKKKDVCRRFSTNVQVLIMCKTSSGRNGNISSMCFFCSLDYYDEGNVSVSLKFCFSRFLNFVRLVSLSV